MQEVVLNILAAVVADVIAYYICKWLDSCGKGK